MAFDSGFNLEFKHGGSSRSLTSFSNSNRSCTMYLLQDGSSLVGPVCEMGRKAGGWLHMVVIDRRQLVWRAGSGVGHNTTALTPWVLCCSHASSMEPRTPDQHEQVSYLCVALVEIMQGTLDIGMLCSQVRGKECSPLVHRRGFFILLCTFMKNHVAQSPLWIHSRLQSKKH